LAKLEARVERHFFSVHGVYDYGEKKPGTRYPDSEVGKKFGTSGYKSLAS